MGNRASREETLSKTSKNTFSVIENGLYVANAINNQITNEMYKIFPPIDTKKYMINAVLTKEPVEKIKNYYHEEYQHGNFIIYEIKKSTEKCQIFHECIRILQDELKNEQRMKEDLSSREQKQVTIATTTPEYHLYMVVIRVNTDIK